MRVDAHQHFWSIDRGDYTWLTPALGRIYRDYGPADLAPHLARTGVSGTVLVQAAATVAETDFMLSIADATDVVLGVVGWIDFEDPAQRRDLDRLARHPKFKGLRPLIQDIPDVDWMLRSDIDWTFHALAEMKLTFDALGFPRHLDNFLTLFRRHPDLRVVVDHGMKPSIAEGEFDVWAAGMSRIAAETPAFCKLSGLVTEAGGDWSVRKLAPYARHILEAFGQDRVMWGSDWPVVELAADYEDWFRAAETLVAEVTGAPEASASIFGGTARRFYGL